MPELPEVETTRRGLEPLITDRRIVSVHIYKPRLRWEIPTHLTKTLNNQTIRKITRRAKYLLLHFDIGQLVMHLGMSGSISVVNPIEPLKKHEHFELKLDNSTSLRFNDPRRFGSVLWQKPNETLTLLKNLGPEPLSYEFDNDLLFKSSHGKSRNIKSFIMDSNVIVGVGNIYASESLFVAGISPIIGLYGAFMMGIVTSLFGGRPGMISGATGAMAVVMVHLIREGMEMGGQEMGLQFLFFT